MSWRRLPESEAEVNSEKQGSQKKTYIVVACIAAAIALLVVLIVVFVVNDSSSDDSPRNVIIFIPDGTGPATITAAREFARALTGTKETLNLDDILVGTSQTRSADSLVTDSAAGATAFAACKRSYNGAVSVDVEGLPLGTVFEAAKKRNMVTGFVVTSRVTHATPACFSSHATTREDEAGIAYQQATEQYLDFALGGGREFYDPAQRTDGENLYAKLQSRGYWVMVNRSEFDRLASWTPDSPPPVAEPHPSWAAPSPFPFFGLFADSHMAYEIDRWATDQPSLSEMTTAVLRLLEGDKSVTGSGGRGFLMMVEGSRVDHAGHANDPAAHMRDALAFDETIAVALDFAKRHPNTLIISVADHETGGFTIGRDGIYQWYPEVLIPVNMSCEIMAPKLMGLSGQELHDAFLSYTSISLTADEEQSLIDAMDGGNMALGAASCSIISEHSLTGWTTGGHTGVDVNLYASGPRTPVDILTHSVENTEVCEAIVDFLDLDLEAVTAELRESAYYKAMEPKRPSPDAIKDHWH